MDKLRKMTRTVSYLFVLCLLGLGMNPAAYAGIVSTAAVVDAQQAKLERAQLHDLLARKDVHDQLVAMGVDPAQAQQRVSAMTDSEVHAMAGKLQQLPAGGDVLGVAVFIFLVLLITDILGYTDVFPFVKKTVH